LNQTSQKIVSEQAEKHPWEHQKQFDSMFVFLELWHHLKSIGAAA
jgi:hypothetical protein